MRIWARGLYLAISRIGTDAEIPPDPSKCLVAEIRDLAKPDVRTLDDAM